MSELCISNSSNSAHLLIHDSVLYLPFLIFFLPFFLKGVLVPLSPLLLALFAGLVHHILSTELSQRRERLRPPKIDDGNRELPFLETSMIEAREIISPPEVKSDLETLEDSSSTGKEENSVRICVMEEKRREDFKEADNGLISSRVGYVKKEKEWKRTLACKLFEERHNVDAADGMDSLWETYEREYSNSTHKPKPIRQTTTKKKKKSEKKSYKGEEKEDIDGQLCCLQALNLSARKVKMRMGRSSLVRITKVIKRIGWLHHVSSNKVHNNGDKY